MLYIAHRHYKTNKTLAMKRVDIPIGTHIETIGDVLSWNNAAVCFVTSEDAHQYFARDDDHNGLLRGKLTQAIQHALADDDNQISWQARWDKVWEDKLCQRYKMKEHEDYWYWNHDFFNAPILDLYHIASLVGAKY